MKRFLMLNRTRRAAVIVVQLLAISGMIKLRLSISSAPEDWLASSQSTELLFILFAAVITLCVLLVRGTNRLMLKLGSDTNGEKRCFSPLFTLLLLAVVGLVLVGCGLFVLGDALLMKLTAPLSLSRGAEIAISLLGLLVMILLIVWGLRKR